ncbi:hypothetical protein [Sphaerisporangium perillae]|nr:hypothetical protein [Sphaerisporangium perillae]
MNRTRIPTRTHMCSNCHGTGIDADNARCSWCNGTGIDTFR